MLRYLTTTLLAGLVLLCQPIYGAEKTLPFRGVQPGVTTQQALLENSQWGSPMIQLKHELGHWWFYNIPEYKSVRAFLSEGQVQAIDVTLKQPTSPQDVAKAMSLGQPQQATLGKYALLDADLYSQLQAQKYDAGAVVLFVTKTDPVVNFVRYYVPQEIPGDKVADKPKPDGDKPKPITSKEKPVDDKPQRIVDKRPPVDFYGVIPGKTTKDELLKIEKWGEVVKKAGPEGSFDPTEYFGLTPDPENSAAKSIIDGYELLQFRVGLWPKVTAIVEDDIVWAVDAMPPPGTEPAQLAKLFDFGRPMTDEELEKAMSETPPQVEEITDPFFPGHSKKIESREQLFARVGPRVIPSAWYCVHYNGGLAALFTEQVMDKQQVKLMRFYASVPVRPASLGVRLKAVDEEKAKRAGLDPDQAVEIVKVFDGSAAHEAGVREGDVIVEFAGKKPPGVKELVDQVKQQPIGSRPKVILQRDSGPLVVEIKMKRQSLGLAFQLRGATRVSDGLFDAAIADFNQMIRIVPKDPDGYQSRAVALRNARRYNEAYADFSKAIEVDPTYVLAYLHRGHMALAAAKIDQAIADYDAVIRLQPENTEGYISRGNAWGRKGQYERALADYNRAIEINPENASAYANRGATWHNKKEYDKALADYAQAIDLNPVSIMTYQNRGYIYMGRKQYDKALEDFDKVVVLAPKYARGYFNRGSAFKYLKQYEKAIDDYSEAIRLAPKQSAPYRSRGELYKQLGQNEKAAADLKQADQLEAALKKTPPPPPAPVP